MTLQCEHKKRAEASQQVRLEKKTNFLRRLSENICLGGKGRGRRTKMAHRHFGYCYTVEEVRPDTRVRQIRGSDSRRLDSIVVPNLFPCSDANFRARIRLVRSKRTSRRRRRPISSTIWEPIRPTLSQKSI
jgi:hypothetical protein